MAHPAPACRSCVPPILLQVSKDLYEAVVAEYPLPDLDANPLALQRALHEAGVESRAARCYGRDAFIQELLR